MTESCPAGGGVDSSSRESAMTGLGQQHDQIGVDWFGTGGAERTCGRGIGERRRYAAVRQGVGELPDCLLGSVKGRLLGANPFSTGFVDRDW